MSFLQLNEDKNPKNNTPKTQSSEYKVPIGKELEDLVNATNARIYGDSGYLLSDTNIGQISTIKGIDPSKFGSTMYNIDDYISGRANDLAADEQEGHYFRAIGRGIPTMFGEGSKFISSAIDFLDNQVGESYASISSSFSQLLGNNPTTISLPLPTREDSKSETLSNLLSGYRTSSEKGNWLGLDSLGNAINNVRDAIIDPIRVGSEGRDQSFAEWFGQGLEGMIGSVGAFSFVGPWSLAKGLQGISKLSQATKLSKILPSLGFVENGMITNAGNDFIALLNTGSEATMIGQQKAEEFYNKELAALETKNGRKATDDEKAELRAKADRITMWTTMAYLPAYFINQRVQNTFFGNGTPNTGTRRFLTGAQLAGDVERPIWDKLTNNWFAKIAKNSIPEGFEESLGEAAGGFGYGLVKEGSINGAFNKAFEDFSNSGEEFFWGAFGGGMMSGVAEFKNTKMVYDALKDTSWGNQFVANNTYKLIDEYKKALQQAQPQLTDVFNHVENGTAGTVFDKIMSNIVHGFGHVNDNMIKTLEERYTAEKESALKQNNTDRLTALEGIKKTIDEAKNIAQTAEKLYQETLDPKSPVLTTIDPKSLEGLPTEDINKLLLQRRLTYVANRIEQQEANKKVQELTAKFQNLTEVLAGNNVDISLLNDPKYVATVDPSLHTAITDYKNTELALALANFRKNNATDTLVDLLKNTSLVESYIKLKNKSYVDKAVNSVKNTIASTALAISNYFTKKKPTIVSTSNVATSPANVTNTVSPNIQPTSTTPSTTITPTNNGQTTLSGQTTETVNDFNVVTPENVQPDTQQPETSQLNPNQEPLTVPSENVASVVPESTVESTPVVESIVEPAKENPQKIVKPKKEEVTDQETLDSLAEEGLQVGNSVKMFTKKDGLGYITGFKRNPETGEIYVKITRYGKDSNKKRNPTRLVAKRNVFSNGQDLRALDSDSAEAVIVDITISASSFKDLINKLLNLIENASSDQNRLMNEFVTYDDIDADREKVISAIRNVLGLDLEDLANGNTDTGITPKNYPFKDLQEKAKEYYKNMFETPEEIEHYQPVATVEEIQTIVSNYKNLLEQNISQVFDGSNFSDNDDTFVFKEIVVYTYENFPTIIEELKTLESDFEYLSNLYDKENKSINEQAEADAFQEKLLKEQEEKRRKEEEEEREKQQKAKEEIKENITEPKKTVKISTTTNDLNNLGKENKTKASTGSFTIKLSAGNQNNDFETFSEATIFTQINPETAQELIIAEPNDPEYVNYLDNFGDPQVAGSDTFEILVLPVGDGRSLAPKNYDFETLNGINGPFYSIGKHFVLKAFIKVGNRVVNGKSYPVYALATNEMIEKLYGTNVFFNFESKKAIFNPKAPLKLTARRRLPNSSSHVSHTMAKSGVAKVVSSKTFDSLSDEQKKTSHVLELPGNERENVYIWSKVQNNFLNLATKKPIEGDKITDVINRLIQINSDTTSSNKVTQFYLEGNKVFPFIMPALKDNIFSNGTSLFDDVAEKTFVSYVALIKNLSKKQILRETGLDINVDDYTVTSFAQDGVNHIDNLKTELEKWSEKNVEEATVKELLDLYRTKGIGPDNFYVYAFGEENLEVFNKLIDFPYVVSPNMGLIMFDSPTSQSFEVELLDISPGLSKKESSTVTTTNTELPIEEKKADIERRRQEELNIVNNIPLDINISLNDFNKLGIINSSLFGQSLFNSITNIAKQFDIKIRFTNGVKELSEGAAAHFDSNSGTVLVNLQNLYESYQNTINNKGRAKGTMLGVKGINSFNDFINYTVTHELIHGVTQSAYNDVFTNTRKGVYSGKLNEIQVNAIKSIGAIFNYLKTLNTEQYFGGVEYGLHNMSELMAEMSNEGFVSALERIQLPENLRYNSKNKNIFENIISFIRDLFIGKKVENNTAQSLFAAISDIITSPQIQGFTESNYTQNSTNTVQDKINAKYDAELAKLQESSIVKEQTEQIIKTTENKEEKKKPKRDTKWGSALDTEVVNTNPVDKTTQVRTTNAIDQFIGDYSKYVLYLYVNNRLLRNEEFSLNDITAQVLENSKLSLEDQRLLVNNPMDDSIDWEIKTEVLKRVKYELQKAINISEISSTVASEVTLTVEEQNELELESSDLRDIETINDPELENFEEDSFYETIERASFSADALSQDVQKGLPAFTKAFLNMIPQVTWDSEEQEYVTVIQDGLPLFIENSFGKLALIAGRAQTLGRILEALNYYINSTEDLPFDLTKQEVIAFKTYLSKFVIKDEKDPGKNSKEIFERKLISSLNKCFYNYLKISETLDGDHNVNSTGEDNAYFFGRKKFNAIWSKLTVSDINHIRENIRIVLNNNDVKVWNREIGKNTIESDQFIDNIVDKLVLAVVQLGYHNQKLTAKNVYKAIELLPNIDSNFSITTDVKDVETKVSTTELQKNFISNRYLAILSKRFYSRASLPVSQVHRSKNEKRFGFVPHSKLGGNARDSQRSSTSFYKRLLNRINKSFNSFMSAFTSGKGAKNTTSITITPIITITKDSNPENINEKKLTLSERLNLSLSNFIVSALDSSSNTDSSYSFYPDTMSDRQTPYMVTINQDVYRVSLINNKELIENVFSELEVVKAVRSEVDYVVTLIETNTPESLREADLLMSKWSDGYQAYFDKETGKYVLPNTSGAKYTGVGCYFIANSYANVILEKGLESATLNDDLETVTLEWQKNRLLGYKKQLGVQKFNALLKNIVDTFDNRRKGTIIDSNKKRAEEYFNTIGSRYLGLEGVKYDSSIGISESKFALSLGILEAFISQNTALVNDFAEFNGGLQSSAINTDASKNLENAVIKTFENAWKRNAGLSTTMNQGIFNNFKIGDYTFGETYGALALQDISITAADEFLSNPEDQSNLLNYYLKEYLLIDTSLKYEEAISKAAKYLINPKEVEISDQFKNFLDKILAIKAITTDGQELALFEEKLAMFVAYGNLSTEYANKLRDALQTKQSYNNFLETASPEDLKILKTFLTSAGDKPIYYGDTAHEIINGEAEGGKRENVKVLTDTTYIKSSVFYLIPAFIEDVPHLKALDSFVRDINAKNPDKPPILRMPFGESIKKGKNSQYKIHPFKNSNGSYNIENFDYDTNVMALNRNNFGLQFEIDPHKERKIKSMSQARVLLFDNYDPNRSYTHLAHTFPDEVKALIGQEGLKEETLNNVYHKAMSMMYVADFMEFMKEYSPNYDNPNSNIRYLSTLAENLKKKSDEQDLRIGNFINTAMQNEIEAVDKEINRLIKEIKRVKKDKKEDLVNGSLFQGPLSEQLETLNKTLAAYKIQKGVLEANNKFLYPLYLNPNYDRLQSMVLAEANKKVMTQKVNGISAVLVSEDVILNESGNNSIIWVNNSPKIKLAPNEIILPSRITINGKDVNIAEIEQRLNLEGRSLSDDPDFLMAFGGRVPTGAKSAIAGLKIVGFLPEYYDQTVVASKWFVALQGADFDVDKLVLSLTNANIKTNKEGNITTIKTTPYGEIMSKFMNFGYYDLFDMYNELSKSYNYDDFRAALENIVLKISNTVMQHPDNLMKQLAGTTYGEWEKIAESKKKTHLQQAYGDAGMNLHVASQAVVAGDGIGAAANMVLILSKALESVFTFPSLTLEGKRVLTEFPKYVDKIANNTQVSLGKELDYNDEYVPERSKHRFKQYEVLDKNKNNIGTVVVEYRGKNTVILHPKLNITNKGYGKNLYKLISSKFNVEIQEWNEGNISNSSAAKYMWDSLEKEGVAKRIIDNESGYNFRVLNYNIKDTKTRRILEGFEDLTVAEHNNQLLQVFLDDQKKQFTATLGINTSNLSITLSLVSLGYSTEDIIKYINDPAIITLCETIKPHIKGNNVTGAIKALEQLLDEKQRDSYPKDTISIKSEANKEITLLNILNFYKNNIAPVIDLRTNTKGFSSTVSKTDYALSKASNSFSTTSQFWNVATRIGKYLMSFIANTTNDTIFIEHAPAFKKLTDTIRRDLRNSNAFLTDDDISKSVKSVINSYAYMVAKQRNSETFNIYDTLGHYESRFEGIPAVGNLFRSIKSIPELAELLDNNALLNSLISDNSNNSIFPYTLELRAHEEIVTSGILKSSWERLLYFNESTPENNAKVQDFAKELINYAMFVQPEYFKNSALFKHIPEQYLTDLYSSQNINLETILENKKVVAAIRASIASKVTDGKVGLLPGTYYTNGVVVYKNEKGEVTLDREFKNLLPNSKNVDDFKINWYYYPGFLASRIAGVELDSYLDRFIENNKSFNELINDLVQSFKDEKGNKEKALQQILNNQNNVTLDQKFMVELLLNKLSVLDSVSLKDGDANVYTLETNSITLKPAIINGTEAKHLSIILEEMIHAVTVESLNKPTEQMTKEFNKLRTTVLYHILEGDLKKLNDEIITELLIALKSDESLNGKEVTKVLKKYNLSFKISDFNTIYHTLYTFKNLMEFVPNASLNKTFVNFAKSISDKKFNIFKILKNFFSKMFDIIFEKYIDHKSVGDQNLYARVQFQQMKLISRMLQPLSIEGDIAEALKNYEDITKQEILDYIQKHKCKVK